MHVSSSVEFASLTYVLLYNEDKPRVVNNEIVPLQLRDCIQKTLSEWSSKISPDVMQVSDIFISWLFLKARNR